MDSLVHYNENDFEEFDDESPKERLANCKLQSGGFRAFFRSVAIAAASTGDQ